MTIVYASLILSGFVFLAAALGVRALDAVIVFFVIVPFAFLFFLILVTRFG